MEAGGGIEGEEKDGSREDEGKKGGGRWEE